MASEENDPASLEPAALSQEYSETMKKKMGSTLGYNHDAGMNYARVKPQLIVGSCLQKPGDVDKLHSEGVGLILCLQEDGDMKHFNLDLLPILQRAEELGIRHIREPIRDFDPFHLRKSLPHAVGRLAKELALRTEAEAAYVHCTAGLGRAPAVALAHMFWVDAMCLDEAYKQLFEVRRCHPQLAMIRAATCDVLVGGEGAGCETTIAVTAAGATEVEIAGLDVGWGARLQLQKSDPSSNIFQLRRALPPGRYQYKFIIDGEWIANPDLPTTIDNGNLNNVIEVDPPAESLDAELRSRLMNAGGRPTKQELEQIKEALSVA